MNKFLKYFGMTIIAVIAIPFLLVLIYASFLAYKNPRVPDWAGGLSANTAQANKEWNIRVQQKFQSGDDVAPMLAILQDGQFEIGNTPDGKHQARHRMQFFPCTDERRIVWTESSDHKISNISGTFAVVCPRP